MSAIGEVGPLLEGAGKYDGACNELVRSTGGEIVVVMIVDGKRGSGFSIAVRQDKRDAEIVMVELPHMLRDLADKIEETNPLSKGVS